jgi:two-component system, LytTR family, sensor kinase
MHVMYKVVLLLTLVFAVNHASAQIRWRNDSIPFNEVAWNNMSTSYFEEDADKMIALVTAIPYNGIDQVDGNKELDMYFTSSYYKYQSNLSNHFQKLDTYDSGNVYFVTPGIFKNNADSFEFRVLEDGETVMKPWSPITQFADSNFQLNSFKKFCGFLGGYHTTWDHFITVQLRRKNNTKFATESSVYWKQVHPQIAGIYTSDGLNEFLKRLKNSYVTPDEQNKPKKWTEQYAGKDDSMNHRPKTFVFEAGESNIIFYLNGSIYWKEALEYALVKDGKTVVGWKPNDFDNNFIWLNNLAHGSYELKMRYRKQRHNTSAYLFAINPFWYQTKIFILLCIMSGSLLLLFIIIFINNRRKLRSQKRKTETLQLEQKAVRAQLNPHFTFNAMSSIQSLMNQSKIEEANYYFAEFSSLLRDSMRNNEKEMLPLSIELQTAETYIKLEQLRFAFQYQISVAENINASTVEMPALLLQPLIENAIKHGISSLHKEGIIILSIIAREKDILVTIQDNGKGFLPQEQTSGYGLLLTKERLKFINQNNTAQNIAMEINSNTNGTTVLLTFKNWL